LYKQPGGYRTVLSCNRYNNYTIQYKTADCSSGPKITKITIYKAYYYRIAPIADIGQYTTVETGPTCSNQYWELWTKLGIDRCPTRYLPTIYPIYQTYCILDTRAQDILFRKKQTTDSTRQQQPGYPCTNQYILPTCC
jgi:hypothetical protein